jgi:hypothetical protein
MLLAFAGAVFAQTTTTPSQSDSPKETPKGKKIADSYIVVLNDSADPDKVAEKKKQEIGDLKLKHVYKHALKGFAV